MCPSIGRIEQRFLCSIYKKQSKKPNLFLELQIFRTLFNIISSPGAVTVSPILERIEQYNATAIRVIWRMPEFGDIVNEWYVEYRLGNPHKADTNRYKALPVSRDGKLFC